MPELAYLGPDRWVGSQLLEHGSVHVLRAGKKNGKYFNVYIYGFASPLRYSSKKIFEREWIEAKHG